MPSSRHPQDRLEVSIPLDAQVFVLFCDRDDAQHFRRANLHPLFDLLSIAIPHRQGWQPHASSRLMQHGFSPENTQS